MAAVEKNSKAKQRHANVARLYKLWLDKNPTAKKKRRIEMFNTISDNEVMGEELRRLASLPVRKKKKVDAVD